ncbi:MAG: hypothetical protein LW834_21250 [Cyanobium sp. 49614_E6]|jgi:hypothetical protein|nr:hypothetical protein [Cyanobium sp. 49614_E6]
MKLFPLFAAAALTLAAAPAQAQWQGGAPQAAAAAYCASRAAGNDSQRAENDAKRMLANNLSGGFATEMAAVLMSGRQMMQTTGYLARQMCPEYFGSAQLQHDSSASHSSFCVKWDAEAREFVNRACG